VKLNVRENTFPNVEKFLCELPVAVIHAPIPPRRSISECIALLAEDSTATIDVDFARDVEAAVESHREPLEPPAWD
jgi:hypothetical protein